MNTENLSTLKIHKLTQAQYERERDAGRLDENALYLTPDEAMDMTGYATKEYVHTMPAVSYGTAQSLDAASRTTAKNNVGVYVGETEPADALDGDIWVNTNESATVAVKNIHLVNAGSSSDLSSIDFSKYAVGDIILVTMSS